MRILLHCFTWIAAVMVVFLFWVPMADAHPLGNFTINHYAGLQVADSGVEIDYVLDMAEIPAFQEINHLDTNRNRKADPAETVNYPAQRCHEVNPHLELQINQQPLPLSLDSSAVEFPPGVGGLATLRLTCTFRGSIALAGASNLVEFEDKSYAQRLGWREITVATNGALIQGNFTSSSVSKRLRDYPNDLLSSPLNQRRISFEIHPSVTTLGQEAIQPPVQSSNHLGTALTGRSNDAFTNLVSQEEHNLPSILIALAIAFVWGGLHALSPGHGKTVVGAYLVGSRSKAQHAIFLGLIVTLTHTASIFALGLVALGTSEFMLTEQVYPWLSALSGLLVTGIGLNLLSTRLRGSQIFRKWARHGDDHQHQHTHDHSHQLATTHGHEQVHAHAHHDHDHNHGHHDHSHLPPGADGSPMTWSSILALGISGGLLPCPSALVVLLSAIALGQIGFGLALVSAFSLGLAAVLTGIGLMLVYTKAQFERLSLHLPRIKMLPAVSALFITFIGVGITTQALFTRTP